MMYILEAALEVARSTGCVEILNTVSGWRCHLMHLTIPRMLHRTGLAYTDTLVV